MNLDDKLELAFWWKDLKATTNERFFPLYFDDSRYLVLKGGGGSGKSIFAGRKVLERCVTEPGHRFLVCRKVGKTIRESCFQQLIGQFDESYSHSHDMRINRSDMRLRFDNGSEIIFTGLDDVEKLKSIYHVTSIWIEEASELQEPDFNQLDIRLRDESPYYKQMILSFNPISITHWLKKRFFDNRPDKATLHESTYKDNRFLDDEAIAVLEAFKETDEYYYTVYCLGQWGVTGRTVFDAKAVSARLSLDIKPLKTGHFEYDYDGLRIDNIRFVEEEEGPLSIYCDVEQGRPYVIGGDTAGDGSDANVLQCIDNITAKQVAVFHHTRMEEDEFARQSYCLGVYYNQALIGIESNWSTYPIMELERLGYPRQYVRERMDDFTHAIKRSYGFRTDTKTRPVIIAGLVQALRDDISIVSDKKTLEEMLTFVRDESLRPEAEEGAHDDTIMALAIAEHIRPQQRTYIEKPATERVPWTDDMWEDYNRGSAADKAAMIKRWGEPIRR